MALNEEQNSLMKLAQFHAALREELDIPYLKQVINQIDNINCRIPNRNHIGNQKPELIGSTLLHLAQRENNYDIFKYLLDRGIDYTITNQNGSTAILQPIEGMNERSTVSQLRKLRNNLNGRYTDFVLSAHAKQNNFNNPCNNYGISHFHVACMLNKATIVKFFLENQVSVDEAISCSSPILPGYSPLHLAITSESLETIEILLEYGAKVNCKDVRGITPLHMLIENKFEIVNLIANSSGQYLQEARQEQLQMIDEKMVLLLKKLSGTAKIDDTGLTHLHVACILPCIPMLQQFVASVENVNQAINMDSPFFPGYTPLHFAMLFKSDLVTSLLAKGANILIRDANGTTPLVICLDRYGIEDVHSTLSSVPGWSDILMTDGRTRLLDLIYAMRSVNTFNYITEQNSYDVNAHVPFTSPLFAGLSTLHLAVIFSDEGRETPYCISYPSRSFGIIAQCFLRKAYLYARDSYGSTALHLAFRLHKIRTLDILLGYNVTEFSSFPIYNRGILNAGDRDNLSITHIAAAANDLTSVEKLLVNSVFDIDCPVLANFKWFDYKQDSNSKDKDRPFFITKGSTLLHIAVATGNFSMARSLLERDANIYARDANGLTPIHRVLATDGHELVGNLLMSRIPNVEERVVAGANLSHLHVACYLNNVSVVERLVNNGSHIEAVITCASKAFSSLSHLEGFTPLHIAMQEGHFEVIRYLLDRGADILARKPDGSTPLYENLMKKSIWYSRQLLSELWPRKELLKHIEVDAGLSILHLACHLSDLELIRDSLKSGVNVNSRVYTDSPIWPGCTPLHILITRCVQLIEYKQVDGYSLINDILKLLLSYEADVSVLDSRFESPLHLANAIIPSPGTRTFSSCPSIEFVTSVITEMLSSIRNFTDNNPRNSRGISLFHIACRICHVETMRKYLESGCYVNQQIGYYSCNRFAGYTPLHLVASCCLPSVQKLKAIELLLNYDADCNVKDIFGNTPLHTAARFNDDPLRENILKGLIGKGAKVNLQNLLGETPFEIVLKSPDISAEEVKFLLDSGCNANTHNPFTALGYLPHTFDNKEILDILINSSKIHETDDQGRTAIHNIVSAKRPRISKEEYFTMIQKLIKLNCDLDHQDQLGRTALHLSVQFYNSEAVCGLLIAGADINILDVTDNSAASYNSCNELSIVHETLLGQPLSNIRSTLAFHLHKLRFFNLDVIQRNIELLERYGEHAPIKENRVICFSKEITKVESLHVGSTSMPLRNLLSETGVVSAYMLLRQREDINEFFENGLSQHQFQEMESVLRLQYRKVLKRWNIMKTAINATQNLAKHSATYSLQILQQNGLPELCCEMILSFLTNKEVDNLIVSIKHLKQSL